MLKYLIQKGYVNLQKLLLTNYQNLNLSEVEVVVLLKLFEMLKNNQVNISVKELSKKMSLSSQELGDVLGGLYDKDYITIILENKNGKTKESFNLDNFIARLEDYFKQDMASIQITENESLSKQIVNLVEQTFKRTLTPLELQIVLEWAQAGETLESIQQALAMAVSAKKTNLKYVDSCLIALKERGEEVVLDEEKTKILADFYRNIK